MHDGIMIFLVTRNLMQSIFMVFLYSRLTFFLNNWNSFIELIIYIIIIRTYFTTTDQFKVIFGFPDSRYRIAKIAQVEAVPFIREQRTILFMHYMITVGIHFFAYRIMIHKRMPSPFRGYFDMFFPMTVRSPAKG